MELKEDKKLYYKKLIGKLYDLFGFGGQMFNTSIEYLDTLERVYKYIEALNVKTLDLDLNLNLTYSYLDEGKLVEGKKRKLLDKEFKEKDVDKPKYRMFTLPDSTQSINMAIKPICKVNGNTLAKKPDILDFDIVIVDDNEDYDDVNVIKDRRRIVKLANGKYMMTLSKKYLFNISFMFDFVKENIKENTL